MTATYRFYLPNEHGHMTQRTKVFETMRSAFLAMIDDMVNGGGSPYSIEDDWHHYDAVYLRDYFVQWSKYKWIL